MTAAIPIRPSWPALPNKQNSWLCCLTNYKMGLFLSQYQGNNLALGHRKHWPLWDNRSSPRCPTPQLSPRSRLSTCKDQRAEKLVKIWRFMLHNCWNWSEIIQLQRNMKVQHSIIFIWSAFHVTTFNIIFASFQADIEGQWWFVCLSRQTFTSVMYLNVSPTRSWK